MPDQKLKWSELTHFNAKQKQATKVADSHRFTLYGGAAGGGKSYWLRWYTIRWLIKTTAKFKIKGLVAGLFCEDYPSLKDRHLSKMQNEFPDWLGVLSESSIYGLSFKLDPSLGGGILALRNLDDASKYFSSEFGLIAVDELTKNPKETFEFLRMRLRWPSLPDTKFIAGTNPGELGHEWVKKIWIDKVFDEYEQEREEFAFVPATVDDNSEHIDPSYIKALDSLPPQLREAYRYGNWEIFKGQFFSEFSKQQHVKQAFQIPDGWARGISIDISGRNGITSAHWYAIDYDGNVWCYKEYYATGKDSDQHAEAIAELCQEKDSNGEVIGWEPIRYIVFDNSAWDKLGYPETTIVVYQRTWNKMDMTVIAVIPCSKNRLMRWDVVHTFLRWDEKTQPKLRIFENCRQMIRTIPTLIADDKVLGDLNTRGEDHAADDLGYFLQTLRDTKTEAPKNPVQRRLEAMKESREQAERAAFYRGD
jgi:phage terminase large subunit